MTTFLCVVSALFLCVLNFTPAMLSPVEDNVILQQFDKRIVNGQHANVHEWPWQVSILIAGQDRCGGSIISDEWILTAAHCVDPFFPLFMKELNVVVGDHSKQNHKTSYEKTYGVKNIIVHKTYNGIGMGGSNVALVQLNTKMAMNKGVQPIALPPQGNMVKPGTKCFVTGWGTTKGKGPSNDILKEAEMQVVDFNKCIGIGDLFGLAIEKKTTLCAGQLGSVGCQGDSGGPLSCKEGGRWIVRGVAGWGDQDCSVFYNSFARVSSFVDWIKRRVPTAEIVPTSKPTTKRPFTGIVPTRKPTTKRPFFRCRDFFPECVNWKMYCKSFAVGTLFCRKACKRC